MDNSKKDEIHVPPDELATLSDHPATPKFESSSTTASTTAPAGSEVPSASPKVLIGQKGLPGRHPIKAAHGVGPAPPSPSVPITLKSQAIVNPLPPGIFRTSLCRQKSGLLVTTSHQQVRPSILHSKQLKSQSDKSAAISLANIVTADGTTSLKIAGGSGPPNLAVKLPNIIRTPSGYPHSPQGGSSILRPSSAETKADNSVEMPTQVDVCEPQQHVPSNVQIFPLSSSPQQQQQQQQHQPQSNVMCLSIVNGKIQNIRDPIMQNNLFESQEQSNVIVQSSQNLEFQITDDQDSTSGLGLLHPLEETLFNPASGSQELKGPEQIVPKDEESKKSSPKPLEHFGLTCSTNEFNAIEIRDLPVCKTEITGQQEEEDEDSIDLSCKEVPPPSPRKESAAGPRIRDDDILCCGGCGCYGMAGEFLNSEACSTECQNRIILKIREKEKRERELKVQKARREAKKKEREAREAAEKERILKEEKERHLIAEKDRKLKEELEAKLEAEAKLRIAHQEVNPVSVVIPSTPVEPVKAKEEAQNKFLPWKEEGSFCWDTYLEYGNARAAPSKLFKFPFPAEANPFKPGMKLEAIDPEHPSLVCVVTVVETLGYRVRLHFDGYSDSYDFWENANSPNLFHAGWCSAKRQKLEPPKNYQGKEFKWPTYLRATDSKAAPFQAFSQRPEPCDLSGWRIGLKLEAVDRQNTSLVCVASVSNIMDGRILVHFDGWEMDFDYWTYPNSPYIHPLGWCEQNGVKLIPPKGYSGEFTWERYLKESMSLPAPNWCFKPPRSEVSLFRKGMKLEAVDKRNPSLIRVASVADVLMHQIKIHFDGWPNIYDFWVEDISLDIHPPTWCSKTSHPLMPPLTNEEVHYFLSLGGCRTPGCRGSGHVKGPKYASHQTTGACPYAPENLDNESILPDRLHGTEKIKEEPISLELTDNESSVVSPPSKEKKNSLGRGNRKRKPRKFFDEVTSGGGTRVSGMSRGTSPTLSDQNKHLRLSSSGKTPSGGTRPNSANDSKITKDEESPEQPLVRCNVFQPGFQYTPPEMPASAWEKNSDFLRRKVAEISVRDVAAWSPRQVAHFVSTIPGIRILNGDDVFHRIIEEEIDGEAFLLLTQTDLVKMLGLKLGPAIKIFNSILLIRTGTGNDKNGIRDIAG